MIQVSLVERFAASVPVFSLLITAHEETNVEEARFLADLQTVRCQLELYKIQHNEQLPPTETYASFEQALTTKGAEIAGRICRRCLLIHLTVAAQCGSKMAKVQQVR